MKQEITTPPQDANAKLKLMETFGETSFDRHYFAEICDNPLTGAFKKKSVVHAGLGGTPVATEKSGKVWHSLSKTQRRGKTSAYIHIPFCTPTALESNDLRQVLDTVHRCLPLANDCQITVEGRINDLTEEKLQTCITGGANRFSIGVQSFDTGIRTSLGRLANRQTVMERLLRLKQSNHAAIIIDLIFGLPDQTMEIWEKDIDTLLDLELDGVDLYQLIRFPGGRLDKAAKSGRFKILADQTQRALMFEAGVNRMNRARYQRLSISHWGRKFRERNRYNLAMKEKADCVAQGMIDYYSVSVQTLL